ncbi:hypothetical protein B0H14DRAFT_2606665 [Mycena olivaceomarginata]|nr:hypothetical protein B0H14DRAFT_2606665 [Mycena olivaceomarginata]
MTAAVYQGDRAQEFTVFSRDSNGKKMSQDTQCFAIRIFFNYTAYRDRHNFMQPFSTMTPNESDNWLDLIAHTDLEKKYEDPHMFMVYFWACMATQFQVISFAPAPQNSLTLHHEVNQYISSLNGRGLVKKIHYRIDLLQLMINSVFSITLNTRFPPARLMDSPSRLLSDASLLDPPGEAEIIASISLRDYHSICYSHLRKRHYFPNPAGIAVNLGSIRQFLGPAHERSVGIAFAPDPTYWLWEPGWRAKHPLIEGHWNAIDESYAGTLVLENGWIRWLAQANHIFNCLHITSNHADYFFVDEVRYWVRLLGLKDNLPPRRPQHVWEFLTVRPIGPLTHRGEHRLSKEEARNHGFPDLDFQMECFGTSWDTSVYAGISRFHKAKGFDPHSQEVAIHLGCPLLQVSCDRNTLFTNVEESCTSVSDGGRNRSGNDQYGAISGVSSSDFLAAHFSAVRPTGCVQDFTRNEILNDADMGDVSEHEEIHPNVNHSHPEDEANVELPTTIFDLDLDTFVPSRGWKIIMLVQLVLILILCATSLSSHAS